MQQQCNCEEYASWVDLDAQQGLVQGRQVLLDFDSILHENVQHCAQGTLSRHALDVGQAEGIEGKQGL